MVPDPPLVPPPSPPAERDAFDTLFDHAPDKLSLVKKVSRTGASRLFSPHLGGSRRDAGGVSSW